MSVVWPTYLAPVAWSAVTAAAMAVTEKSWGHLRYFKNPGSLAICIKKILFYQVITLSNPHTEISYTYLVGIW